MKHMYKVTARLDDNLINVVVQELNIYNAIVEASTKLKCTYEDIIMVQII